MAVKDEWYNCNTTNCLWPRLLFMNFRFHPFGIHICIHQISISVNFVPEAFPSSQYVGIEMLFVLCKEKVLLTFDVAR